MPHHLAPRTKAGGGLEALRDIRVEVANKALPDETPAARGREGDAHGTRSADQTITRRRARDRREPSPGLRDQRRSWADLGGVDIDARDTDTPKTDESAAAIARRLLMNIGGLAQAYADLAREEARGTLRGIVRSLVCFGLAAVLGVYAVGLVLLTVVLLLSLALPSWLAALITFAGAVLAISVLVAIGVRGLKLRRVSAVAAQMRSDIRWLRDEILKNI